MVLVSSIYNEFSVVYYNIPPSNVVFQIIQESLRYGSNLLVYPMGHRVPQEK